MMTITTTPGVDTADLGGGYTTEDAAEIGVLGKVPLDHPRFQAALRYISAHYPQLTEAVIVPNFMVGAAKFPSNVVFKKSDGSLSFSPDTMRLLITPEIVWAEIGMALRGEDAWTKHTSQGVQAPSFAAWYNAQKAIAPVVPGSIIGPKDADMTAVFGAPTYSFAGGVDGDSYAEGQAVTDGGKQYTVRTMGHPFGRREWLVAK